MNVLDIPFVRFGVGTVLAALHLGMLPAVATCGESGTSFEKPWRTLKPGAKSKSSKAAVAPKKSRVVGSQQVLLPPTPAVEQFSPQRPKPRHPDISIDVESAFQGLNRVGITLRIADDTAPAGPESSRRPAKTYTLDDRELENAPDQTVEVMEEAPAESPAPESLTPDSNDPPARLITTDTSAAELKPTAIRDEFPMDQDTFSILVPSQPRKTADVPTTIRSRPPLKRVEPNDLRPAEKSPAKPQPVVPASTSDEELPTPDTEKPATESATEPAEEVSGGFKAVNSLGVGTRPKEVGTFPRDIAAERFQREGELHQALGYQREWAVSTYSWTAPDLCHYPLYFEDVNLERHGYSFGLLQPAVSALNFYGRIPILPYLLAAERPRECVYTLGHYRPGSYAPFHLHRPPLRAGGLTAEAATITALFLVFP